MAIKTAEYISGLGKKKYKAKCYKCSQGVTDGKADEVLDWRNRHKHECGKHPRSKVDWDV